MCNLFSVSVRATACHNTKLVFLFKHRASTNRDKERLELLSKRPLKSGLKWNFQCFGRKCIFYSNLPSLQANGIFLLTTQLTTDNKTQNCSTTRALSASNSLKRRFFFGSQESLQRKISLGTLQSTHTLL